MDNQNDVIVKIHDLIRWLETNGGSQDMHGITEKLNQLATNSYWFAETVADANAAMNNAEANYKALVARSVSGAQIPTAKAERLAEVEFEPQRKQFIEWKNLYTATRLKLERIDRILDSFRQRVSVVKMLEVKHSINDI
jgi:hypothetical protein